jgi:hypothetical protein
MSVWTAESLSSGRTEPESRPCECEIDKNATFSHSPKHARSIKLLTGNLEPQGGHVTRNGRLRVAYFTQHVSLISPSSRYTCLILIMVDLNPLSPSTSIHSMSSNHQWHSCKPSSQARLSKNTGRILVLSVSLGSLGCRRLAHYPEDRRVGLRSPSCRCKDLTFCSWMRCVSSWACVE